MSACRAMLLETYRLSWARRAIAAPVLVPARDQPINLSRRAIAPIAGWIGPIATVGACYGCACRVPARALADPSSAARERPAAPTRKQRNGRIAASRLLAAIALFIASASSAQAQADSVWTGVVSNNWFNADNWISGRPQQTSDGTINTVTPNSPVIASTGAAAQNLTVGQNGTGMLTIQAGGTLVDSSAEVGNLPGSLGTVIVSGAGSNWSNAGAVVIGGLGTGTLTIQDGSAVEDGSLVNSGGASIGQSAGSNGTVTVTGPGTSWTNGAGGGLNIGSFGTGTLTIANGGQVINFTTNTAANIGNGPGSQGLVTVTGAGSLWSNRFGLNIGNSGTGTLTIADGGVVGALASFVIAANPGSIGTLNIGAAAGSAPAAPGTVQTSIIGFGAGTGTINFNHTATDYVFAPQITGNGTVNVFAGTTTLTGANSYAGGTNLNGGTLGVGNNTALGTGNLAMAAGTTLRFAAADLSLANAISMTGDPTFDTMGNNATVSGIISGAGATLEKNGAGILNLTAVNTYTGPTNINAGTLAIGTGGSITASSGVNLTTAGTAFDLSGGGNQTIRDLSGVNGSAVTLGANTLSLGTTNSTAFAGVISGIGALIKNGGGTLTVSGANTYTGGTTITAGTLQLGNGGTSGSILGSVTDNGTLAFNRSDTVTFPGVISGSGNLAQLGPGTTILTAANSYSGATNVNAGSLRASAPNTFSPNSAVTIAGGGTLDLNGFSQAVPSVINAGLVNMGTGTAPGTILTTANHTGAGGTIAMNTFLGGDGSPSDKLVINGGSATGNAFLRITNAGGPGVETVANGIPVVQTINGGSTATGAFQLANIVEAGPFDYRLFHGSVDASAPNDWFLRDDFIVPPTGPTTPPITPPITPPTPPITALPPDPLPDPLPPGTYPIIGPRLATYGVVQPIARQIGLTTLGTLHERIGDTLTGGNASPGAEGWFHSAWGRVIGQQIDNHYQAFADPRASGRLIGLQFGVDVWRGSFSPGSRDVAGLYFGYLNGDTNIDGLVTNADATAYVLQRTGMLNLNSYSLGGYWTHYGPGGWYLDAVLQGTRYGGDATTQFSTFGLTTTLPTHGSGFVSSLEGGYPIPLAFGPGFVLEPQAQIIWQEVHFDGASDGISSVALGSTSGTTGRLGVRGQWTIPGADGEVWQPYGRFNVWRDWGGNAATSFAGSGIAVPLVEQATRLELAGGLTFKLQANLSFYTQIGYQFAVAPTNAGRDGVKGDIGLQYTW